METNTVEFLFRQFKSKPETSPEQTVEFFQKSDNGFPYILQLENDKELRFYIEMVWQYMSALFQKQRFQETIYVADKHLEIIDGEIERLKLNSQRSELYQGLLFLKGIALYRLRKFRCSTKLFKRLLQHDPKSESYRDWLGYSKYGQRNWITKSITIICCLLMVAGMFSRHILPPGFSKVPFLTIGIVGLLATFTYDFFIARKFVSA